MNTDINNLQKLYEANQEQLIVLKPWQRIPDGYTGRGEYSDGTQYWYKNGILHREDGPAAICHDGHKYWYKNSLKHREDGPAVIWADGAQEWYLDDKEYSREDYWRELHKRGKISDEDLFVELL